MKSKSARALCVLSAAALSNAAVCQEIDHRRGTCEDLTSYVKNTGVQLPDGTQPSDDKPDGYEGLVKSSDGTWHRRNAVGITVDTPTLVSKTFTDRMPIGSKSGGSQCFQAVAHITYTFTTKSRIITWTPNPPACDSGACEAELTRWHNWVKAHEDAHVANYQYYDHLTQTMFANYPVMACVPASLTGRALTQALNLAFWNTCIFPKIRDLRFKADWTDKLIDKVPQLSSLPNCSVCEPCACSRAGPNEIVINGKCYKTGVCPATGTFGKCGLDKQGQAIQCCQVQKQNIWVCADANNNCPMP